MKFALDWYGSFMYHSLGAPANLHPLALDGGNLYIHAIGTGPRISPGADQLSQQRAEPLVRRHQEISGNVGL